MTTRETNVERFVEVYAKRLAEVVATYPTEYAYPVTAVPGVVAKMRKGFMTGSYNKDGKAIALTCKELGIKHTIKAMEAFFNTGPTSQNRTERPAMPV